MARRSLSIFKSLVAVFKGWLNASLFAMSCFLGLLPQMLVRLMFLLLFDFNEVGDLSSCCQFDWRLSYKRKN